MSFVCVECGAEFVPVRPDKSLGRWCSRRCRSRWKGRAANRTESATEWRRRYERERNLNRTAWRYQPTALACAHCGDEVEMTNGAAANFRRGGARPFTCARCSAPAPSSVVPWRECGWCGVSFISRRGAKRCSVWCRAGKVGASVRVYHLDCGECGAQFLGRSVQSRFCGKSCGARSERRSRRQRERATGGRRSKTRGAEKAPGESFTLREIAVRDGWVCHICGRKVRDRVYAARPGDATLDHLVPLSQGGVHVRSNVALAHNACNTGRGADGVAQLRMVG